MIEHDSTFRANHGMHMQLKEVWSRRHLESGNQAFETFAWNMKTLDFYILMRDKKKSFETLNWTLKSTTTYWIQYVNEHEGGKRM